MQDTSTTPAPTTVPDAIIPAVPAAGEGEREHHPYSPSSLANREACPDFTGRDSKAVRAIIGTIAHKATETQEDDQRLDDDDAAAVAECLDFVEERRQVLQEEADNAVRDQGVDHVQIVEQKEIYLPVDDLEFNDWIKDYDTGALTKLKFKGTTAGWVDHVLLNWNITYAEIIDWKFGYWAVEGAETNPQGIAYVLGLFRKYPTLQRIRFWFKQPLIGLLSDHTFDRSEIPQLYLRVQAIVARARNAKRKGDFSTAKAYVPACNFCDNLGRCPIGLANALRVGKKFHPIEFPDDIEPNTVLDPRNTTLALNLAAVVKIWAEGFRRQVTDRVIRGDADCPEGMMLQSMPGRRAIADLAKFREVALRYMSTEEYSKCLDATFGPLEDIITEKTPRGSKKHAIEEFKKALVDSGAVVHGDGYTFLKVKNDKGKNKTKE